MDERGAYFRWPSRGLVCIGLILAAVASASLVWIGGELHYRNCLTSVELRYPIAYQQGEPGAGGGGKYGNAFLRAGSFVFYQGENRSKAIAGCSRWP